MGSQAEAEQPRVWAMGKEAFERRMPHHDGMKALWETKWKFPCTKSVYPFHDGRFDDFGPIFNHLIEVSWLVLICRGNLAHARQKNINDGTSVAYTEAFFPVADALTARGDEAAAAGDAEKASSLYLRACAVLRIARFPYISGFPEITCPVKWRAWEDQKRVYMKAGRLWECPVEDIDIPHTHARGADRSAIPVYVRVPKGRKKCPVVVLMTGLDGYRPDNTVRCDEFLQRGWGSLVVEIPGTADCPADSADPTSPDRLWDSMFEWMAADRRFDMSKVMVWGLSSGGYYAVRIAHTHRDKLVGSVAQGAGCHYFFDREWLERADGHEYPFQ
jgi:hypothetical protein